MKLPPVILALHLALASSATAEGVDTWTAAGGWYSYGYYSDSKLWSEGRLPKDGEDVVFRDNGSGSTMILDLATAVRLGSIYATGGGLITINEDSDTETLRAGVFTNDTWVRINTSAFQPDRVDPSKEIKIATVQNFAIDSTKVSLLKSVKGNDNVLRDGAVWHGAVVFDGMAVVGLDPNSYGNQYSCVRFSGVEGFLGDEAKPVSYLPALELKDSGASAAFNWIGGWDNFTTAFYELRGDGTLVTSCFEIGNGEKVFFYDVSLFCGSINLKSKTIAMGGNMMPSENISDRGRLHICANVNICSNKTWRVEDGVYLSTGAALSVSGELVTPYVQAYGPSASVTLADGGAIRVASSATGGESPLTWNLNAGMLGIVSNATMSGCYNFLASGSGRYTTVDVCGNDVVFSCGTLHGDGTIYPVSSVRGESGSVVFEDLGDFSGTIVIGGTTEVVLPDDLDGFYARGGKIVSSIEDLVSFVPALAETDCNGLARWQNIALGIDPESGKLPFAAPVQNTLPDVLSFRVGNCPGNGLLTGVAAKFEVYEVDAAGNRIFGGLDGGDPAAVGGVASVNLGGVSGVRYFKIRISFE